MKIYIVNGKPRSGKTAFEKSIKTIIKDRAGIISTIDFVKLIAEKCGWDGTKTLENRKFLSDLKDLLTEWNDVPFKKVIDEVAKWERTFKYKNIKDETVIFIDCREPKEIDKLKQALGAKTICIIRDEADDQTTSNHADEEVYNYNYDFYFYNNEDLEKLNEKAMNFLKEEEIL